MEGQSAAKPLDSEYIGKTFGVFKCIEYLGSFKLNPTSSKRKHFKVMCLNCNNVLIVRKDRLKEQPQCCINCANIRQKEIADSKYLKERPYKKVFQSYKSNAKSRNLDFKLSYEEFKVLLLKNCYYCDDVSQGVDRINNNQGYTVENSVSCCTTCNFMKNTHTLGNFIQHIEKIHSHIANGKFNDYLEREYIQANGKGEHL